MLTLDKQHNKKNKSVVFIYRPTYKPYSDIDINKFSDKYKINARIILGRLNYETGFFARKTGIPKTINTTINK